MSSKQVKLARHADKQRKKGRFAEARGCIELGRIEEAESNYGKALEAYFQALDVYQQYGYQQGIAEILKGVGWVYLRQGKFKSAIQASQRALVLARKEQSIKLMGEILGNLGRMYNLQGNYQLSLEASQEALLLARQLGNKQSEGTTLAGIGLVYQYQGQYSQAIRAYQEALKIARQIGYRIGEATILGNLAKVFQYQEDWANSLENYERAVQISRAIGDRRGLAINLGNKGDVLLKQQRLAEAQINLVEAIALCDEIFPIGAAAFRGSLALLYAYLGQVTEAEQVLQEIDEQICVDREEYGKLLCKQAQVYHAAKRFPEAQECMTRAQEIAEKLDATFRSELGKLLMAAERGVLAGKVQLR